MKTLADLNAIKERMRAQINNREGVDTNKDIRVVVGMATCGISAGARPVFNALVDEVAARNLHNVKVTRSGCLGMCKLEPIVEVHIPGEDPVTYVLVNPEKAKNIVANHIVNGNICKDYLITNN